MIFFWFEARVSHIPRHGLIKEVNGGSVELRRILSYLQNIVRWWRERESATAGFHHNFPKMLSSTPPTTRSQLDLCVTRLASAFLSHRSVRDLIWSRVKRFCTPIRCCPHGHFLRTDPSKFCQNNSKFGIGMVYRNRVAHIVVIVRQGIQPPAISGVPFVHTTHIFLAHFQGDNNNNDQVVSVSSDVVQ